MASYTETRLSSKPVRATWSEPIRIQGQLNIPDPLIRFSASSDADETVIELVKGGSYIFTASIARHPLWKKGVSATGVPN